MHSPQECCYIFKTSEVPVFFVIPFTNIRLFIPVDDAKPSSTKSVLSKEVGQRYVTLYQFDARNSDELSLLQGDIVTVRIRIRTYIISLLKSVVWHLF